jgi:hypothetical protein
VRCWLVLLVTSCGRIDFDARPDALTLADTPPAVQCPAGYLPVLGISQLGTQDFCVMQTEARAWRDTNTNGIFETTELDDDGCDTLACNVDWTSPGYLPVSPLPVLADPWRSVSAAVAKNACRALGPQFDLMSNREWITIARSAEHCTDALRGGELVIKAQVPLAEVGDYSNELKSLTGGRGRYSIEFSHYDAVPPQVQKQLVEAYNPRAEED